MSVINLTRDGTKSFRGGLNNRNNPENLDRDQSPDLQNCRIDGQFIKKRKGRTQTGNTLTGAGTHIQGLFSWEVQNTSRLVNAYDDNMYYLNDASVWTAFTDADTNIQTDNETHFVAYTNQLFCVNGFDPMGIITDDTYAHANVGGSGFATSTLNGNITSVSVTIVLVSAADFDAAGSVHIGNDVIAYTGKTATDLTGVTGIRENHSTGDFCTQGVPNAKYIEILNDRMCLAGVFDFPSTFFISDQATPTDPEKIYDFISADADSVLIAGGGSITGLQTTFKDMLIFKTEGHGIYAYKGFNLDLTPIVPIIETINPSEGAVNQNCIAKSDNFVYYFNGKNIKRIGFAENFIDRQIQRVSRNIQTYIDEELSVDQTECTAYFKDGVYYLNVQTKDSSTNDITLIVDELASRQDNFTILRDTNQTFFTYAIHNEEAYAGSISDGIVYRLDVGFSDADEAIEFKVKTKDWTVGNTRQRIDTKEVYIRGRASELADPTMNVYFAGEATPVITKSLGTQSGVTTVPSISRYLLGAATLGSILWGGPSFSPQVVPYERLNLVELQDVYSVGIEVVEATVNASFELDTVILGYTAASDDVFDPENIT